MTRKRATLVGSSAILLWSLLALLTVASAPVPPLQLNAVCFAIAGFSGLIWAWATGSLKQLATYPVWIYAFGTAGLFGYHFLYFSALRAAPPAQAGLIAYLWPLLIVLFSGLLPGENLRRGHLLGAVVAFLGAAIVILGAETKPDRAHIAGFALAFGCALTWSGYSVISRRLKSVPTASIAVFCLLSAGLSFAAHMGFESTKWPADWAGWLAIAGLGFGPVGLAFFVWDVGVKQGDIQLLGVFAYGAPLLSTVILVVTGYAVAHWSLIFAALLISGGAYLAARAG